MSNMNYEPNDINYDEDAKVTGTIVDSDLTHDRMEALARKVVDTWDQGSLLEYAITCLFNDYQFDCDQAVQDANDLELTLEELDNE